MSPLDHAIAYTRAGISVIPVRPDSSKAPACQWKQFQMRIPTPPELGRLFTSRSGIAAICGRVSGNLEVIDFEKAASFENWLGLIETQDQALTRTLVIVSTPSGGHHVYYRCNDGIEGNQKLAMSDAGKVLIETRGEKGYVLTVGSPPACHPAMKPYTLLQGDLIPGSGEHCIPNLTAAQRALLLDTARAFNQDRRKWREYCQNDDRHYGGNGNRPGDLFNRRATWDEVIGRHGWMVVRGMGDETLWRRPGKDCGSSATTNYKGSDRLYVFSTNATPLEYETSYSKFEAYAVLEHGGDFGAAAKAIAKTYNLPKTKSEPESALESNLPADTTYIEFAPEFLSIEEPPPEYIVCDLLPAGVIALLHGEPRARKSWAALDIAIALATGTPAFGLERFSVSRPLRVLYSSQEDGRAVVQLRAKALLKGRNIDQVPKTLAFSVHKNIDFDLAEWRERLLLDIVSIGFRA